MNVFGINENTESLSKETGDVRTKRNFGNWKIQWLKQKAPQTGPTAERWEPRAESVNWKTKQWELPNQKHWKKQLREEQSLRDPWDYNKRSNICVISIPEGRKERQKKHSEKEWPKTPQIWQEWQSINSRNSDPKEKSKEIHTKTNQNEISEN